MPSKRENEMLIEKFDPSKEYWLFIQSTNGSYSISSHGRVRSNGRKLWIEDRNCFKVVHERILNIHIRVDGYSYVSLGGDNTQLIHRLVGTEFIANPLNKPCINHKDGNKKNNRVDNLEWVTYSENEIHSYQVLGKKNNTPMLNKKGIDCCNSKPVKITYRNGPEEVFPSATEAAPKIGIDTGYLRELCRGVKKGLCLRFTAKYISREEFAELKAS